MKNYEIELKEGYEFKEREGGVVQVETMKEAVAIYKEWKEHIEVIYAIDKHGDILDDATEIVKEYAGKGRY